MSTIFIHTIRKLKFLSKKLILTNFLVKSRLSIAKKSKTAAFSRVFTKTIRQFFSEIKVEFLDKKWKFRTVCFKAGFRCGMQIKEAWLLFSGNSCHGSTQTSPLKASLITTWFRIFYVRRLKLWLGSRFLRFACSPLDFISISCSDF